MPRKVVAIKRRVARRTPVRLSGLGALLDAVSDRISPSQSESDAEKAVALDIIAKLEAVVGPTAVVYFVGSTARDTGLRGDRDIDLFVSFPPSLPEGEIVSRVGAAVRKAVPARWEMHYAEHPYYQGVVGGYKVEVIPCYAAAPNSGVKSAVDRSPLHMDYLQKRLSQSQKRDVRCLKKLLKAHGVYGAEASIGGFSGLLCEYLVLNFRSLELLSKEASSWAPPVAVDIEGHAKGASAADLSARFGMVPLVVVDAIDGRRNAAAAVSLDSLNSFISLMQSLSASPSEELFFPKPLAVSDSLSWAKSRSTHMAALEFSLPENTVEDIFVPQLRKSADSIYALLSKAGFRMVGRHYAYDGGSACILFESLDGVLPKLRQFYGPPAYMAGPVRRFVAQHAAVVRGPYIEDGRVVVEELGEETSLSAALRSLLSSESVSLGHSIESRLRRAKPLGLGGLSAIGRLCLSQYASKRAAWL